MGKKGRGRQKSIALANMIKKEEIFNIYAGSCIPPKSPVEVLQTPAKLRPSINTSLKDDKSMEEMSKFHSDYSPKLPVISKSHHFQKPNFIKQNLSIASQVIRSYRSFSRKHAFNLKFEIANNSEEQTEVQTYDNAKESESTKDNSISKYKKQNRWKSQISISADSVPEKIITVKPIDGRKMLESIQETKETEQK